MYGLLAQLHAPWHHTACPSLWAWLGLQVAPSLVPGPSLPSFDKLQSVTFGPVCLSVNLFSLKSRLIVPPCGSPYPTYDCAARCPWHRWLWWPRPPHAPHGPATCSLMPWGYRRACYGQFPLVQFAIKLPHQMAFEAHSLGLRFRWIAAQGRVDHRAWGNAAQGAPTAEL